MELLASSNSTNYDPEMKLKFIISVEMPTDLEMNIRETQTKTNINIYIPNSWLVCYKASSVCLFLYLMSKQTVFIYSEIGTGSVFEVRCWYYTNTVSISHFKIQYTQFPYVTFVSWYLTDIYLTFINKHISESSKINYCLLSSVGLYTDR